MTTDPHQGPTLSRIHAITIALVAGLLTTVGAWAQAISQDPGEHCSLAVVSRLMDGGSKVCDNDAVKRLAAKGQAFEQNQMGIASVLVVGPDSSPKEAIAWFQKAAQRGYAPAQVNLAVLYANGWGTPVNYGVSLQWLHAAADQHFARAYYNLGILYLDGRGVKQDYAEALRWFRLGADAGDTSAQTNLGYLYDVGLGCKRDLPAAVNWYRKAAEAGNPLAENNLADLYFRGEGMPQDDAVAFSWFQKAAAQGQTGARIKLGFMYASGRGTTQNPETAYMWVSAATMAGDPRGNELVHALGKNLTTTQIAHARERAIGLQVIQSELSARNFAQ